MNPSSSPLSIGQCATLACLLEVTAPKPGNVHRAADFPDLHFADFLTSATAIGPVFERAHPDAVGITIRDSIKATRSLVNTNTNLGIVLLLAPLACVPRSQILATGIDAILEKLSAQDAQFVYEAIQVAQPGGMGEVSEHDIRGAAPESLLDAMEAAKERDMIARQYVNRFADVFAAVEHLLMPVLACGGSLFDAIVWTHLGFLAHSGDSLIERKRGTEANQKAQAMARKVIDAGPRELQRACGSFLEGSRDTVQPITQTQTSSLEWSSTYWQYRADLDFWMRSDLGRNPGTTADLVTATVFCVLREQRVSPPFRWHPATP